MVNKCNCKNVDRCSIVDTLPAGFKCPYFVPIDADSKFEMLESSITTATEEVVETKIKNGMLEVVIQKEGKKVPVKIDITQVLDA